VGKIAMKSLAIACMMIFSTSALWATRPTVHVQAPSVQGPRTLQEQTQAAVVRNYLQAWGSFTAAFDQNNAGLLDSDFVGTAREKLGRTIQEQAALGVRTKYQDLSHDLRVIFYSPEGLSIELTDDVEYDVQVLDHDKVQTTQRVKAHYIVVMTPAEVRWRVRILQPNY
jgi:hypothetical protein